VLENDFKLARISAVECLGRIANKDSTERLLARLSLEDFGTQAYIVRALGDIRDPRALPVLAARLIEVKAMDQSVPERGGSRGDPPTPALMQATLEAAIADIGSEANAVADDGDRSWLRPRDNRSPAGQEWTEVSPLRVRAVPSWHAQEAKRLLGGTSSRKLITQDAERLELAGPTSLGRRSAYLIRAVSNARTRREFTVLASGSRVVIQHNSFAAHATFQKDAVVVFLDNAPSTVFVETSVLPKPDALR